MASLFEIGKTGVQAYRQALSVTGQNIANINTDGYNKRSADISGRNPKTARIAQNTRITTRRIDVAKGSAHVAKAISLSRNDANISAKVCTLNMILITLSYLPFNTKYGFLAIYLALN